MRSAVVFFFLWLARKIWPAIDDEVILKYRWVSTFLFFVILTFIIIFTLSGCATPRSNSIFKLQFEDHAPTALMRIKCNGIERVVQGIFACEEKEPKNAEIKVKIMPVPGQLIYSDGLTKKIEDFNWAEKGLWIFKKKIINDTWIDLDPGELKSIYGDVPIAFNVTGLDEKVGVIVNRGIIYNRWCNDRDIPCSKLIVSYDCAGTIKNTWDGQLGYCARMSESSQKFSIPTKTISYELPEGARILIRSGRTAWTYKHDITANDIENKEIKIMMPTIITGPDLISFRVIFKDQGVPTSLDTHILISGYDPRWTGIDSPHWIEKKRYKSQSGSGFEHGGGIDWHKPVLSDLMEVFDYDRNKRQVERGQSTETKEPKTNICGYAWQRSSGALTYTCIDKHLREIEHP